MFGIKLTRRIITGLILIYLSGLGYAAEIIIPFTHISHKVEAFTAVLILAEIFFFTGVAVLGKPLYKELKTRLTAYLKQKNR
jgi:hypothetical protein